MLANPCWIPHHDCIDSLSQSPNFKPTSAIQAPVQCASLSPLLHPLLYQRHRQQSPFENNAAQIPGCLASDALCDWPCRGHDEATGGGACGGMYMVGTLAMAIETMDMMIPGSNNSPAENLSKQAECENIRQSRICSKRISDPEIS